MSTVEKRKHVGAGGPAGKRPRKAGGKPSGGKSFGGKPSGGGKSFGGKPSGGGKSFGGKPGAARKRFDAKGDKGAVQKKHEDAEDRDAFETELNRMNATVLRKTDSEVAERTKLVAEIFAKLSGEFKKYAPRPSPSRAIQCCFRFGTPEMREQILSELEGSWQVLSEGKYSCFLVIACLRYGDDRQRVRIMGEFRGKVYRLATHATCANVLEFCFSNCDVDRSAVNKKKKGGKTATKVDNGKVVAAAAVSVPRLLNKLRLEFYGKELAIWGEGDADAEDPLAGLDDKKRRVAIDKLNQLVVKQADKGILRFAFAHSIALRLVRHCEKSMAAQREEAQAETEAKTEAETEAETEAASSSPESKIMQGLIPLVAEACLAMVSSEDGAAVVARCIANASAKDRKKFVRALKGHVAELLFHNFGFVVLLALLNTVDDTVLLRKSIMPELAEDKAVDTMLATVFDPAGLSEARAVYLQLFQPGSGRYLRERDLLLATAAPGTSKKDAAARAEELAPAVHVPLARACASRAGELLRNQRASDLLVETMQATWDASLTDAVLAELAQSAKELLEDRVAHRAVKRLVLAEAKREPDADADADAGFATRLVASLPLADLLPLNRPCFVLTALASHPAAKPLLEAELAKPALKQALAKADSKGAEALKAELAKTL